MLDYGTDNVTAWKIVRRVGIAVGVSRIVLQNQADRGLGKMFQCSSGTPLPRDLQSTPPGVSQKLQDIGGGTHDKSQENASLGAKVQDLFVLE